MYDGSPPIFYNYQNVNDASHFPIHGNAIISRYFKRYLLQKAISVFKWKLPDWWAENFLLYCLYCFGYVAVFETDKFGVIFQPCGLRGYDVFYRPTHAVIANPLIDKRLEPQIGKQCELLRLMPDYGGIMDIVSHYAEQMAICVETLTGNMFNSRLAYVFFSENKAATDSFTKMYDQISSGKPVSIIDKALRSNPDSDKAPWELFTQNLGQNYIADQLLSDLRKIEAMFDTDIGIPNANTDKRERLITDEVNANNIEVLSKCSLWLQELQKSCKRCNDMFGLDLAVNWRFDLKEVNENASDPDNNRPV